MSKIDKEYFTKLGKRLRHLRQKYSYTLSDIAKYLDVSKQTVGSYEQGSARIQIPKLYQLSLLYKVNLIEFFIDVEEDIPDFHNPEYEKKHDIKVSSTEKAIFALHSKLQKQITEVEKIKHQLEDEYGENYKNFANDGGFGNKQKEG